MNDLTARRQQAVTVSNYEAAEANLGNVERSGDVQRAQVYAALAQADAIDRLTDALERMQFPELTVKKCLGGLGFSVKPVTR